MLRGGNSPILRGKENRAMIPNTIVGASALFPELRAGNLGVRLASTSEELDAVQALRFRIFYEELGAKPDAETKLTGRDRDQFDPIADHLLVVDHDIASDARGVVGTYRLIRQEAIAKIGHFYSADEYDLSVLQRFPGRLLELGRSCVDQAYRSRAVMQLLWRGIAAYVFQYDIDLMFGCASLHGTNLDELAPVLTYLYMNHLAPEPIRPRAVAARFIEMRRLHDDQIDAKQALAVLPPLVKGYLRLGGFVGDGAVIDWQFNTTDIAVIVQTELVTDKYYRHYERQAR